METPPDDMPGKINLLTDIFNDQESLINQYVTKQWGPVAQCFVPYKEVLPVYDAGLKVPPEATLIWTDDNFGYIRRLSSPAEQKRPGGAGVYWHLSYYGSPHSYTWINTTAPAFIWEEFRKAWDNNVRNLWIINVGDIKPMELGIDHFSRLAWNPEAAGPDSQPIFLRQFAEETFGRNVSQPLADLLAEFYRLGTIHKPELMNRAWAVALPQERADELTQGYTQLLQRETEVSASIPALERDAYFELIGFPAQVLGETGLIFMADRNVQYGKDANSAPGEIGHLRKDLDAQVQKFNHQIVGGKWNLMMPGVETTDSGLDPMWKSEVRWPWGEPPAATPPHVAGPSGVVWRDPANPDQQETKVPPHWVPVKGLGSTGRAMVLEPASGESGWKVDDVNAPALGYNFVARGGDADAHLDFLPTFRLYPGRALLRVAVGVDDGALVAIEVPGSSGHEDEHGQVRSIAVQDNFVRVDVPLHGLAAGKHVFRIRAVDPGVVIDRIALPGAF